MKNVNFYSRLLQLVNLKLYSSLIFYFLLMVAILGVSARSVAQIAPNLGFAKGYALLADSSIFISDSLFISGKVGSNDSVSINVYGYDSILPNGTGSVIQALIDLDSAIQFCETQTSLYLTNTTLDGLSLNPNVYLFQGLTTFNSSLALTGDTSSIYIFILDTLIIGQHAEVTTFFDVEPHNIFWIINDYVNIDENVRFPGTILCKGSIYVKTQNFRRHSLLSLSGSINIDNTGLWMNNTIMSLSESYRRHLLTLLRCVNPIFVCDYVADGDMEQYKNCPTWVDQVDEACFWYHTATIGAEYWHTCNGSVPTWTGHPCGPTTRDNFGGSPNGGYSGFVSALFPLANYPNYREYISSNLIQSLIPGYYFGEVNVASAPHNEHVIDGLGIYYSKNMPISSGIANFTDMLMGFPVPQIENTAGHILDDDINWNPISGCFKADGGERYITLGNFKDDANTTFSATTGCNQWPYAYYYVDHVSTIKLPDAGLDQTICSVPTPVAIGDPSSCVQSSFSFYWTSSPFDGSLTPSQVNLANPVVTPSVTTVYTLHSSSVDYCDFNSTCTVYVEPNIVFQITGPSTMCDGGSEILDAGFGYTSYFWSTGATTQTITINNPGTYSVSVTNSFGCTGFDVIHVLPGGLPEPIVEGDLSLCKDPHSIWHFNVANCNSNYIYTWTFIPTPVSVTIGPGGCTADVAWSTPLFAASVTVTVYDPNSHCDATTTYCLQDCCLGSGHEIVIPGEITYSDFVFGYCTAGPTYSSGTPTIFNGVLHLTGNMTFSGSDLQFGPGAKIIVDNGANLNIQNCTLGPCTDIMWQGIELRNTSTLTTADVVINDAQYGIKVMDQSSYNLFVTYFNRNYVGIYIPPDVTPHANPGFMDDVYFDCAAALINAFPCQTPTPLGKTYAGIFASDVTDLQITTGSPLSTPRIHFTNLNIGIKTVRTNPTVTNPYFENILSYDSYGAFDEGYCITANGTDGNFLLDETGLGKYSASPTILNCRRGIRCIAINANVFDNYMEQVNLGVRVESGDNRSAVVDYNKIVFLNTGISAVQNLSATRVDITSNDLISDLNIAGVGINADETFANPHLRIMYNDIIMNAGRAGIRVNKVYHPNVYHNQVHINISDPNDPQVTNGIHLTYCDIANVSCNSVDGLYSGSCKAGIHCSGTTNSSFTCNYTNLTETGIMVDQGCGSTLLKGNTMDIHDIGLYYGQAAITGPQSYCGNIWAQTSYVINGALHGVPSLYPLSIYSVTTLPPTPAPAGWFISPGGTDFLCDDPVQICFAHQDSDDGGGGEELRMEDYFITSDSNLFPENQSSMNWMLKRYLFEKLTDMPSLIIPNTAIDTFYSKKSVTSAGLCTIVRDSILNLLKIPSDIIGDWNLINDSVNYYRNIMLTNDSILFSMSLDFVDSIDLALVNQNIRTSLNEFSSSAISLNQVIEAARLTKIEKTSLLNESLPDSTIYEQNEKIINRIFLNTIAQSKSNFSPSDSKAIYDIASQCPLTGGSAVYKARSLYILINDTLIFDDDEICQNNQANRNSLQHQEKTTYSEVYPVPSNSLITLKYTIPEDENAFFKVYNIYGQLLKTDRLDSKRTEFIFSTEIFSNGIYFYKVVNESSSLLTNGKFIVNK